MKIKFCCLAFSFCLLPSAFLLAQHYSRTDTIPVKENNLLLKMPWMGGLNHCQFSDIDLNFDGIKDLVAFDRTGNKLNTFINNGTAGQVDYVYAPQYEKYFPHIENWMLLADYNCDGKEDIFTFNYLYPNRIRVYKNTSTATTLQFTLEKEFLQSDYPGIFAIYVTPIGLPAIEDIDGDGDLDVLMFSSGAWNLDYHVNQSVELGYGCDSLIFKRDPSCFGHFTEVASTCSATLTSCRIMGNSGDSAPLPPPEPDSSLRNGGSCLLCLDMDADGDKELYLGQLYCCQIALLTNGGNAASANMTSVTADFPNTATPVNLNSFPCAYFLDLNNDNKRDLVVSSSSPGASNNSESIWYYENTGSDNAPVFIRKTRKLFQENMIDVGEGADPVFFDFDNDGLTDLLISNYDNAYDSCTSKIAYNVAAYKNIGTSSQPQFNLATKDYANISSQLPSTYARHLTFGDVDADGDQDMFIGDYNGNIHFFQNTAGAGNPANFVLSSPTDYLDAGGNPIDIGSYATPQLVDVDRDGDLDLIIGELAGNINYYKNIGSATVPSYSLATPSFGGVDVKTSCCSGYSVPFMYDSLGSYRMIVGSESNKTYGMETGWLWYYKNIDGNLNGNFTMVDSTYQNIWEGLRMTITGKDITNDGYMDLVIGNYAGGVSFYMGDTLTTSVPEIDPAAFDFSLFPNPSSGKFTLTFSDSRSHLSVYKIEIYNTLGEKVYSTRIQNQESTTLNLSIPNGIYYFELSNGGLRRSKKIVVLK